MKTALYIISLITILSLLAFINERNENTFLTFQNKALKSSNNWKTKRLKNYVEITIIQDHIIVNDNQTRKVKGENKQLLELTQNLY
jgi:hypothetical protein